MMKMLMPALLLIFLNKQNLMFISSSMIMLLLLLNLMYPLLSSSSILMILDNTSMPLIILSMTTLMLVLISSNNFNKIFSLSTLIFMCLILTFSFDNMLMFYILFELSLIPTFLLITKSGKQPERLQAAFYLFIYMLVSSLPLLIGIISTQMNNFSLSFITCFMISMPLIFMLAFLTKLPMFFLHLWLPKAHVEAPLEGSMILAAILLKLGGYGLLRFSPLFLNNSNKFNYMLMAISLMGALLAATNCFRHSDLKALVAYSSVAHMALILASISTSNSLSIYGSMLLMIAHGLTSSALFLMVDTMYSKFHSRTIIIFNGILHILPNISFWWFISIMINMSAPPSINTLSEIILMSSIISWNPLSMMLILMSSMMLASFSILTFISINHNINLSNPINNPLSKTYLSLFFHLSPLLLLLMKSNLFYPLY